MPTTAVIERPHAACFSRNELRYAFFTNNISAPGVSIQIILFFGTQQITVNLKPDTIGYTYFYIDGYIDSYLQYKLPTTNQTFNTSAYTNQTVEFYIHYREVNDATIPAYITTEASKKRIAYNMGIIREKYSRNNFFVNYFTLNKPWLTWLPTMRTVGATQNVFLSCLILPVHAGKTIALQIAAIDIYGTSFTRVEPLGNVPAQGMLQHLNVSIANLSITGLTTNKINTYSVSIIESGTLDTIVSQYGFTVSYTHLYNYYDLYYFNSLGGIDDLRVTGEVETGINKDFTEVDNGIDINDWQTTIKKAQTSHVGITTNQSFKGDIGFLEDENEQDIMSELLISRSIWQYVDSRWLPVINLQKSTSLRLSTDKKFSLPIEWRIAISNQVFTPTSLVLGLGTDVETYP